MMIAITEIIMYSTPTCQYCRMAKKFFRENKIEYREIDVSADYKSAYEMINRTGQLSVPVIVIRKKDRERVLVGFDREELSKAIGIEEHFSGIIKPTVTA